MKRKRKKGENIKENATKESKMFILNSWNSVLVLGRFSVFSLFTHISESICS